MVLNKKQKLMESSSQSDSDSDFSESSESYDSNEHIELETAHLDNAIVKVFLTEFTPNYEHPWTSAQPMDLTGSGAVINQARGWILTCAHVALPNAIVWVRLGNDLDKYPAKVLISESDCDLGLLQVDDPRFRQKCQALPLGEFQKVGSPIASLGFPIINDELTTTYGTIIANEVIDYTHGDSFHLASTTDACINPGQTGGPVIDGEGKLVGVAFQAVDPNEAEKAAFLVPVPVIRQFLTAACASIESNTPYRGIPSMPFDHGTLNNRFTRAAYKMREGIHSGVCVQSIDPLANLGGLKVDDVILSIDEHRIHNDGTISSLPHINERLDFNYLIYRKNMNESVNVRILRDGVEQQLVIPLRYRARELKVLGRKSFDNAPTFYIKNGLCFQPFTISMYDQMRLNKSCPALKNSAHGSIIEISQNVPNEQWVIVNHVFNSPLTLGYEKPSFTVLAESGDIDDDNNGHTVYTAIRPIESVNGKKINHMHDLVFAMESHRGNTHCIILRNNEKITLRVATPGEEQAIAHHYQIYKSHSDDLSAVIKAANKQASLPLALPTEAPNIFTRKKGQTQDHHKPPVKATPIKLK